MKSPVPNLCVLVTLGILTLTTIAAGYFHGNMHIEAVYKSLFT
jgi:hypothetical protein